MFSEYFARHPAGVQKLLRKMRATIKKAAPKAKEKMSYGIPTFELHGNLVHFAAFKRHIGFYPGGSVPSLFKKELAGYKTAKGSVQFPLDEPLPLAVITKIVKFRVRQNLDRAKGKKA